RYPQPAHRDVVDLNQRRPAARQPEQPLEGHGIVEVAPDLQLAALERLHSGQLAAPQPGPRLGVGGDGHIRPAPAGSLADPGGVAGAADLPGMPQIAELYVVGGVEAGVSAQVAVREGPKPCFGLLQTFWLIKRPCHSGAPHNRSEPIEAPTGYR